MKLDGKSSQKVSFLRIMRIEVTRILKEKMFRTMVIAIFIYCAIAVVLHAIWPVSLYIDGGKEGLRIYGQYGITSAENWSVILDNSLWKIYFPFIAISTYAHVMPDERTGGFVKQLYMKMGLRKYISSKFITGSLFGGIMALCPFISAAIVDGIIKYNPITNEIVEYCNHEIAIQTYSIFWKESIVSENVSLGEYIFTGAVCWFLVGILFGLIGCLIGCFTNNKLFIYILPIMVLQFWDFLVYLIPVNISNSVYLKNCLAVSGFGSLDNIVAVIIMIVAVSCITILCYPKIEQQYYKEVL